MNKTPTLLAFGIHNARGSRADTRFFRKEVKEFLEDKVLKEGKMALYLPEWGLHPDFLRDLLTPVELEVLVDKKRNSAKIKKKLDRKLSAISRFIDGLMERTINAGIKKSIFDSDLRSWIQEYSRKEELDPRLLLSLAIGLLRSGIGFGVEPELRNINAQSSNRIRVSPEPLRADVLLLTNEANVLEQKIREEIRNGRIPDVDLALAHIKVQIDLDLLRDQSLFTEAIRLSRLGKNTALILTRGWAHRGMRKLFEDSERFDLVVREKGITEDFLDEAQTHSYIGRLSEDELRAYATLQSVYYGYLNSPVLSDMLLAALFVSGSYLSERKTRRARQQALDYVREHGLVDTSFLTTLQ